MAPADHAPAPEKRLLLVRHGLPDYSCGKRVNVPPGPQLSFVGQRQAAQAAEVVAPFKPERVYASPLARARKTGEILARRAAAPLVIEPGIAEWQPVEKLSDVNVRLMTWFRHWVAGPERVAVAVSHASPLLSIMRGALYLPHNHWHARPNQEGLRLSTADRFEVSMASVYELTLTPEEVRVKLLFHPSPRIVHVERDEWGCEERVARFPRFAGDGERKEITRPNRGPLVGYRW